MKWQQRFTAFVGGATLLVGGVAAAPSVHAASDVDALVLNVLTLGDQRFGLGAVYWCDDTSTSPAAQGCGLGGSGSPAALQFQQSLSAQLFTDSDQPASFTVSDGCAVGSAAANPAVPATTSAQIAAGDEVFVTALRGTGQCVLTAKTPGGGNLTPGTFNYTIALSAADQTVSSLPKGQRLKVGQRVRLQGSQAIQTNAGQNIAWSIAPRSRRTCQLTKASNGAVFVRATSRGSCRVQATARAVSGQWKALTQTITFRVG